MLETNSAMYWSPDGALLAWMSFDVATVHEYTIPVYANNPYPANRVYGYPAPGYANAMVDVWVYSTTDGGAPTHVQLDADGGSTRATGAPAVVLPPPPAAPDDVWPASRCALLSLRCCAVAPPPQAFHLRHATSCACSGRTRHGCQSAP